MYRAFFGYMAAILILTACATSAPTGPQIHIEGAWARPVDAGAIADGGMSDMQDDAGNETTDMPGMTMSGTNSAAYFMIMNDGDEADTLIGASSEVASSTEMHETRIENDVAQMAPVQRVDVPAHGSIEFRPGGYHVMLVGLNQDLIVGDTLKLTLQFEKSGEVTLDVPIQQGQ